MLLYDHVPFSRNPGAHDFGPRNVPDKANSTVSVQVPADGVAVAVASATGFPTVPFFATLDAGGAVETVRVTARSANVFTVERQQPHRIWAVGARFQVLTTIIIRFARKTTGRPELWADGVEIAAQLYITVDGVTYESGGFTYIRHGTLEEFNALVAGGMTAGQAANQLIAEGKIIFGGVGGIRVVRGVDLVESTITCPCQPGLDRVVTGVLGVRGGTFNTELTLEVV